MTPIAAETTRSKNKSLLVIVAFCLSTPLVVGVFFGYEVSLTLLLIPLAVFGLIKTWSKSSLFFVVAYITGMLSVMFAELLNPKNEVFRNLASLTLFFVTAIFYFLGKFLLQYFDLERIVFWLSTFSSIFICVVALRIIILGQSVRIYTGVNSDFAEMNVNFIGLDVFGTFGVISLADLILMQVLVICGGVFVSYKSPKVSYIFMIPLMLGIFLVWGSESRAAQLLIFWVLISLLIFLIRAKSHALKVALSVCAILLGIALTFVSGNSSDRLQATLATIADSSVQETPAVNVSSNSKVDSQSAVQPSNSISPTEPEITVDTLSTGRLGLVEKALVEFSNSPFIGNGFYGFDRDVQEVSVQSSNSSTHIYYLTLLWKGGLLFFLIFMIFLAISFRDAFKNNWKTTNARLFITSTVLMAFGPLAFTWDVLAVPSAGAFAFFLLGALHIPKSKPEV